jgi:glycosyltransferase involved in cell wall biosynthesis
MKQPKITIISPSYNRPTLLKTMIKSVLKQTYTDWELIIIDDSTNNDTRELMYSFDNHSQITYLKNERNEGLPYSRNRGLDVARGTWITYLDDDDFYVDDSCLQKAIDTCEKDTNPWIVFNRVNKFSKSYTRALRNKKDYNWTTDYLYGNSFRGDAVHFIKKNLIHNTRYLGVQRAEWDFWFNLSKKSNFFYYPISMVCAEYLPDGMSNLGYLKKERVYLGQQFREMIRNPRTYKYLPIIAIRYISCFRPNRKSKLA